MTALAILSSLVMTAAATATPVALEDARLNFAPVVQAFVDQRSPKGYWPLRDKNTGKVRRLRIARIEERRVNSVGKARFDGAVILRDQRTGELLTAIFTVDFSAESWRVLRMRLLTSVNSAP